MRHDASLIVALEGLTLPAYRIARELMLNSRSGLTTRLLARKLELPIEEVEYLVDTNHRLFFFDLTKVKLVAEGVNAMRRIKNGLENYADIPSLTRSIQALDAAAFRGVEDILGSIAPLGKKAAVEILLAQCYSGVDTVVGYVASRAFSPHAREVFDILWQSRDGVIQIPVLRHQLAMTEYEAEQALGELFRNYAAFEMFRFDQEERLLRFAGLLSEIRQWRESHTAQGGGKILSPLTDDPPVTGSRGIDLSNRICQLLAAIAAKPIRIRQDGEFFREDQSRLEEAFGYDDEPSISTCLWLAESVGWTLQDKNEIKTAQMNSLTRLPRIKRHRLLAESMLSRMDEPHSRRLMADALDALKPGAWYGVLDFVHFALESSADQEKPILRNMGGHWRYMSLSTTPSMEKRLIRSMEETFFWLGIIDRGDIVGESAFTMTALGRSLLTGEDNEATLAFSADTHVNLIIQPNFDIIAPTQDVDPLRNVPLEQFAEKVSMGQVAIYRLTKDAFIRAVQDGHDPGAFVEYLVRNAQDTGIPANVLSTLDGWRGGVKRVSVRTIHIVTCDDPFVLTDLTHRKRLGKFFETIDATKTIMFKGVSKGDISKELEKEGFVVE